MKGDLPPLVMEQNELYMKMCPAEWGRESMRRCSGALGCVTPEHKVVTQLMGGAGPLATVLWAKASSVSLLSTGFGSTPTSTFNHVGTNSHYIMPPGQLMDLLLHFTDLWNGSWFGIPWSLSGLTWDHRIRTVLSWKGPPRITEPNSWTRIFKAAVQLSQHRTK